MKSVANHFLWLNGVFESNSSHSFPSISVAANLWQSGFLDALLEKGHSVYVIGWVPERAWPLGRFFISSKSVRLKETIQGKLISYLNVPILRNYLEYFLSKKVAEKYLKSGENQPDYTIVFSTLNDRVKSTPSIDLAKYLKRKHGMPWVCIVADGQPPLGADKYIFLAWSSYLEYKDKLAAIHFDGGVVTVPTTSLRKDVHSQSRALMYMGSLLYHGGALELAKAFSKVDDDKIELWLCGQGVSKKLIDVASLDSRIKIKGFLKEDELTLLAKEAFAFANPRPFWFGPNRINYPSKLLHYLAFDKPIISTVTDGLHPDYLKIIIPIESESLDSIANSIKFVMSLPTDKYKDIINQMRAFKESHTWSVGITNFCDWLGKS
jgi:glycosyltransferase involved in cell wall biosynthesis